MTMEAPASPRAIRGIRVLPNRNTSGLLALLAAMWYAGASQHNGAAYLLGFVLTGVAIVSLLHASANLRGLRFSCGPVQSAFVGERIRVPIFATGADGKIHAAVRIKVRGHRETFALDEIFGSRAVRTELWLEATERGFFNELRIDVFSLYPLGFVTAHSHVLVHLPRYIYPLAKGPLPFPSVPLSLKHAGSGARLEGDDFAGLRAYVPGEPQRHIDWKAAARGHGLLVKQWAGDADETLRFTWEQTVGAPHEARVSQLARWVVMAERQGRGYGLALPRSVIQPGRGAAHQQQCLRALAVFPRETELV